MHEKQIQGRLANAHRIAYARKVKSKSTISDGEPAAKMPKLSEDQGDTGTVTVTPEELAAVEEEIRATPLRLLKETEMIKEVWIGKVGNFETSVQVRGRIKNPGSRARGLRLFYSYSVRGPKVSSSTLGLPLGSHAAHTKFQLPFQIRHCFLAKNNSNQSMLT